jgi:hypothetical protein
MNEKMSKWICLGGSKNSRLRHFFLGSILLLYSTGSAAVLLLGTELVGLSGVAGAAINISADSIITDTLAAKGAIGIGARTDTENIYSEAAVATGAGGNAGNIYSGAAAGVAANATAKNIYAEAAVVVGASGLAGNIYSGAAVTLGASSASLDVYAAAAITGGAGANSTSAGASTASVISTYQETYDLNKALEQIAIAQTALFSLKSDFKLGVGIGSSVFEPGVYSGSAVTVNAGSLLQFDGKGEENPIWVFNLDAALVIGAGSKFEIINAGDSASLIWNLGGALGMGAGTSFVGSAFVTGAVAAATSDISCGNLFASAAIGIGSTISTNCDDSDSWAGSMNGLAYGVDITDGVISNKPSVTVSEPSMGLIFSSLAIMLFAAGVKRK